MRDISVQNMGYDRAIVVFSPDGRLFQVEYAKEAVNKGAPALGIVYKDGVVLGAQKRASKLVKPGEKIFKVDDHIGIVATGYVADARILVDIARVRAQQNMILYDEPISVYTLAKDLADRQQLYTQHAGVRPYGVSLLIGGVYRGEPRLFETDPSGAMMECLAHAVGRNSKKINEILEKEYHEDMDEKKALKLAAKCFRHAGAEEGEGEPEFYLVKIDKEEGYKLYTPEEIKEMGL